MRIVVGIDFSLACPGMCIHYGDTWSESSCHFFYLYGVKKWIRFCPPLVSQQPPKFLHQQERLDWISSWLAEHIKPLNSPEIYIEDYSYTSHSSSTHILAEGCGILKNRLWKLGFNPVKPLPVGTIKKFATGKGNAPKEAMFRAFQNEASYLSNALPCRPGDSPLADLIDAYYVAKLGFTQGNLF